MRGSPLRACPYLRKALSFINFAAREINCKIVYYGAGLGGKTTNLQVIYQKTADQQKGKMISLATETERTLFFDFLPLDLGNVRGFKTRNHRTAQLGHHASRVESETQPGSECRRGSRRRRSRRWSCGGWRAPAPTRRPA